MKKTLKLIGVWAGPLIVVGVVVLLEVFAWQGWRLPNPGVVLLPLVIGSTIAGGLGPGLVAAFLSILYFSHAFTLGLPWQGNMAPQGWTSIAMTALVIPLAELIRRRVVTMGEVRLRMLVDNIAQLAWMADADGSVFWTNRRCTEYSGVLPEGMKGAGWQSLVRPDHQERVAQLIGQGLKSGKVWRETYPLRGRDGSYHWFLTEAIPVNDSRGRVKFWLGTGTDITAQIEAEQELLRLKDTLEGQVAERTAVAEGQADQLRQVAMELSGAEQRERGKLAQVLHDDLQQLLVAARIQAAAACRPDSPPEKAAALESLLSRAIETSRSLSKELAPAVLFEEGLGAALHWLGTSAKETYGLTVEVQTSESGDSLERSLRGFLFDVVRELILNVAKHAATDTVRVSLVRTKEEVQLLVEDFGKGFDVENTKPLASGSGLFFMQQRVSLIGGTVDIHSTPSEGTRIDIHIPLNRVLVVG